MSKFNTIGIDLAKQIFQVHINDANGKKLSSKKLKRSQLLDYIRQQPNALVANSSSECEVTGAVGFTGDT